MSNTKYVLCTIVLALAGSVLVFLLVGLVLADSWQVTTSRTIAAEPAQLASKMVDLRQWAEWSQVKFVLGHGTTTEYAGEAGKPDQVATWRGPKGIATVLLTRIDNKADHGVVEYAIGYKFGPVGDSFGGKFTGSISWHSNGNETEMTWIEHGELTNLMQRWSNWFGALQDEVGRVQRASLAGLDEQIRRSDEKDAVEKAPVEKAAVEASKPTAK